MLWANVAHFTFVINFPADTFIQRNMYGTRVIYTYIYRYILHLLPPPKKVAGKQLSSFLIFSFLRFYINH